MRKVYVRGPFFSRLFVTVSLLLLSNGASAKRFSNQYTEFELPIGWECALEGSEWVCQSSNPKRQKEAIIILAAKIRGDKDSLDEYQKYLKQKKTYQLPGGKMQVSEAKYTKLNNVNGQKWIDALHLASEVPGFYTRYLATVKEDLGVAVTFSVTKELYSAYQSVFDKIVASLRVFRAKKTNLASGPKLKGDGIADSTFIPDQSDLVLQGGARKKKRKSSGGSGDLMLYGLLGAAVAGFIFMKRKR